MKNPKRAQNPMNPVTFPLVQESDVTWDQNKFTLFHGTSMENAARLLDRAPLLPIKIQATKFLQNFGLELNGMLADEDFSTMSKYIFEHDRDQTLYTASRFKLARNYALRLPEWQWYLFRHIHRNSRSNHVLFEHWQDMAEDYARTQPNPVVMVIRTPNEVPLVPPEFMNIDSGSEIKIPNPLSDDFSILEVVEISRN